MIDKVVMHGISELLAIEPAWWLLWERCSRRTPFQSPGWLLPWYRAFRPGEPVAFAFWHSGRLVGIAPFYATHETDGFHLQSFGSAVSDFLDMLVEPGWEDLVAEAFAAALAAETRKDALFAPLDFKQTAQAAPVRAQAVPTPASRPGANLDIRV